MWRDRALKIVLVIVGLIFSAGVYPVMDSLWHQNPSMYTFDMMLSLYVALGIFLLLAARNPSANRSLIAFTAWSSFAHAAVMTVMDVDAFLLDVHGGFGGGALTGALAESTADRGVCRLGARGGLQWLPGTSSGNRWAGLLVPVGDDSKDRPNHGCVSDWTDSRGTG